MLFTRARFNTEEITSRFFRVYSEALARKSLRAAGMSQDGAKYLAFETPEG